MVRRDYRDWTPWDNALREVLNGEWDPIGVASPDWVEDEYDSYVDPIRALITDNVSDDALITYLNWVTTERMGLSPFPGQPEKLREWLSHVVISIRDLGRPE